VSGIFLPLGVNSLPLAKIYEVKIPLRKWKKSLLQRNPAQMTWANNLAKPFTTVGADHFFAQTSEPRPPPQIFAGMPQIGCGS
jgi:hypothetical protein